MTDASWVPVLVVASSLLPGLVIFTLPERQRTCLLYTSDAADE